MTNKEQNKYKAGDKVKLVNSRPEYFAAVFNGNEGMIKAGVVYQVSAAKDLGVADHETRPLPYINKELVNHPRFNGLFKAVKSPDKDHLNEQD